MIQARGSTIFEGEGGQEFINTWINLYLIHVAVLNLENGGFHRALGNTKKNDLLFCETCCKPNSLPPLYKRVVAYNNYT